MANTRRRFDRCSNYGSRFGLVSGRLTGLLASLRRAYLGTRAFVTSLRTSSGGLRTFHPTPGSLSAKKRFKSIFRQSSERQKFKIRNQATPSATLAFTAQADHRNDPSRCILLAKLISNRRLAEEFDVVVLGGRPAPDERPHGLRRARAAPFQSRPSAASSSESASHPSHLQCGERLSWRNLAQSDDGPSALELELGLGAVLLIWIVRTIYGQLEGPNPRR